MRLTSSLKTLFSVRNLPRYLIITLVPCFIISYLLTQQTIRDIKQQYTNQAQWYATFHANHLDNFIGETIGRLDMLATLVDSQSHDLSNIKDILLRTQEKDARFSGFYWAVPEGDLVIGTNEMSSPVNVSDRDYFQEALRTGKSSISDAHIGRVTGRYIITIATPVIYNNQVEGLLLASLRIDEIHEAVERIIGNEVISVTDQKGDTLFQTEPAKEKHTFSSSVDVEKVPWTLTATIMSPEPFLYWDTFLFYFAIILVITHILYIVIQYYLLKRQIRLNKEQNEVQKLKLVENLAASTAHEIRNPLTGIKGLIQLLSEKYQDEKDQMYFRVIQEEVNRINNIVSELLLLGKPTAVILKTYNVNEIIKEILPIIQSETNYKNVELLTFAPNDDLLISCVKDHLKQVILNLVKNSLEAMEYGGQLSIALEKSDDSCLITVKDNGMGMSEEIIKQVFNPFFTLKTDGTGLGLPVCKRIIEAYGGTISIRSVLHTGTEVEIEIPLAGD